MEKNCMEKENEVCEINIPDEMPDFSAPGNVGTWRQILAANIGRKVKLEIIVQLDGPTRSAYGEIYVVGNSYVGLICNGKVTLVDILAVKFAYFDC